MADKQTYSIVSRDSGHKNDNGTALYRPAIDNPAEFPLGWRFFVKNVDPVVDCDELPKCEEKIGYVTVEGRTVIEWDVDEQYLYHTSEDEDIPTPDTPPVALNN